MSPIALLLNVLWLLFGGLWAGIAWGIAAVIMAITIIGIPWARAAFNIGVQWGREHDEHVRVSHPEVN